LKITLKQSIRELPLYVYKDFWKCASAISRNCQETMQKDFCDVPLCLNLLVLYIERMAHFRSSIIALIMILHCTFLSVCFVLRLKSHYIYFHLVFAFIYYLLWLYVNLWQFIDLMCLYNTHSLQSLILHLDKRS